MLKRAFDLVVSAVALCFALPVIGVAVGIIRLDSRGPGIFRQTRVGRDGSPFTCLKLRTMALDTPHLPTHETGHVHVTRIGRVLRGSKLDELPQLWNVFKGDMSFVGPRPCLPSQTDLVRERQRRGVLALRPGITGIAQVRGIDMSDPVVLARTDALYVPSMTTDIRLILATFSRRALSDRITRPEQ